MPTFEFTSPEGKIYEVQGPEGSTKEQAYGILQQRIGKPSVDSPKGVDAIPTGAPTGSVVPPSDRPVRPPAPPIDMRNDPLGRAQALYGMGEIPSRIGEKLEPVGEAMNALGPMAGGFGALETGLAKGIPAASNFIKGAVAPVGRAIKGAVTPVANVWGDLRGTRAATATNAAVTNTRAAASSELEKMQGFEDAATRAQKELLSLGQRYGRPDLHKQGVSAVNDYRNKMDAYITARKEAADPAYAKAMEQAQALEKSGLRIDPASAIKPLENLLKEVGHIPELKSEITRQISTLNGVAPSAPQGLVNVMGEPFAPKSGNLTYSQLSKTSRYLKDLAYKSATEGYDSIVPRATKEAAKELDAKLAQFAPEHKIASDLYEKMSSPLETLNTKLGSVLYDTEGGLKNNRYIKTSPQKIPDKIFGTRSGFEQYVDALSGGVNATKEQRAVALAKAEKAQLDWAMETLTHPETGLLQAGKVAAPQTRAALGGSPYIMSSLDRTLATQAAKSREVEEFSAEAKRKTRLKESITKANAAFDNGETKRALTEYQTAINSAFGGSTPQSQALIAQINRASDLKARSEKARKIALYVAGGAIGLGYGGKKVTGLFMGQE